MPEHKGKFYMDMLANATQLLNMKNHCNFTFNFRVVKTNLVAEKKLSYKHLETRFIQQSHDLHID